jgi:hypothetical protein
MLEQVEPAMVIVVASSVFAASILRTGLRRLSKSVKKPQNWTVWELQFAKK